MRIDGEDYSVFKKGKIRPSDFYPEFTPQEADRVRAAFRENSRGELKIPRIGIPRGPEGFIHTLVMSALDAQDVPEATYGSTDNNNREGWSWSRIFRVPQIWRLQKAHR